MIERLQLRDLPGYGKLFVALFTALMLLVCLWAAWLYTVEKGEVDEANLPPYLRTDGDTTGQQADKIATSEEADTHGHWRENLGLAHTHVNGQTLLFFAIGVVFLFTSAKPRVKKTVYWTFGLAIFIHAIGLSGEGFYSFFDDILALSGVVILATIAYMALTIFADLARQSTNQL